MLVLSRINLSSKLSLPNTRFIREDIAKNSTSRYLAFYNLGLRNGDHEEAKVLKIIISPLHYNTEKTAFYCESQWTQRMEKHNTFNDSNKKVY